MDIIVDPGELERRSGDIQLCRWSIEKIMNDIESLILSLNGNWQGDAERACASKIVFIKKEYAGLLSFFKDYADLLEKCGVGYEQYDADIKSKINFA